MVLRCGSMPKSRQLALHESHDPWTEGQRDELWSHRMPRDFGPLHSQGVTGSLRGDPAGIEPRDSSGSQFTIDGRAAPPQLRFASTRMASSRRDLHPQDSAHAGRTNKETPHLETSHKFRDYAAR
jgi:hypothetical protein